MHCSYTSPLMYSLVLLLVRRYGRHGNDNNVISAHTTAPIPRDNGKWENGEKNQNNLRVIFKYNCNYENTENETFMVILQLRFKIHGCGIWLKCFYLKDLTMIRWIVNSVLIKHSNAMQVLKCTKQKLF